MIASENCYSLIKSFEGLSSEAYPDPASGGKPFTIGFGTVKYPNGLAVKLGDKITDQEAEEYLHNDVKKCEEAVTRLIKEVPINQNQYDSLCSFVYNLGAGALEKSTLLKKLKQDPHDFTIYIYTVDKENIPIVDSCEFLKWVRAGGKIMKGLLFRRAAEADLYGQ